MSAAKPPETSLQYFPAQTTTFIDAKVEVKDTQNEFLYKVELPGLKIDEVSVEVEEGNVLKISGKRCVKKEEALHVVSYVGEFMKRYRLPANSKPDETTSRFENGAVIVSVPKGGTIGKPARRITIVNTAATQV